MTLITYITRVHFADGILEEALRSELEVNKYNRPFVLVRGNRDQNEEEALQRLLAGAPNKRCIKLFECDDCLPCENVAIDIAKQYHGEKCDVLIALGSNSLIDQAKIAKVYIGHNKPLSRFTVAEAGSRRIGEQALPTLYAVPSIQGFDTSVSAHAKLVQNNNKHGRLMCRKLVPTVTICDPTLTSGQDAVTTASTGVDAIARCLEAYLSPNYNPPADGIAFDGLRRGVQYLPKVLCEENLEYRREMMAAMLNSGLALQKGLGTSQVIADALQEATGLNIDLGSVRRILLPNIVRMNVEQGNPKLRALADLFGLKSPADIETYLEGFLANLPLSNRLSGLGVQEKNIHRAAEYSANIMSNMLGLDAIEASQVENMLVGAI
ncbi:MAG: iron-containing alcohol dehydrogenase [Hyphomicrobiales bacterium]